VTTLLVSSVGGHLTQLHRLLPRLEAIDAERRWVTFDSPQSRSLLAEEDAIFLDYAGPRDAKMLLRHSLVARRLFRGGHRYSTVISTGSGIALSFLPLARVCGASCHFIESFTRSDGPSLTGRILGRVPGISLYAQYHSWARGRWKYAGSVFDAFVPLADPRPSAEVRRVVVTLGTMEDYGFRRLLERLLAILPSGSEVLWQVGCTDVSGLALEAHRQLPAATLRRAMEDADVVVAHAGCGSSVSALEAGKTPVLVPRSAAHGENVDDHQRLLATELAERGLAVVSDVETLSLADLQVAARSRVSAEASVVPFRLEC
jgi:UDP-N-acetylglucosamine transferase subunit ALG13